MNRRVLAMTVTLMASTVFAQNIERVTVTPQSVDIGQEVVITVDAGQNPPLYCGLVVIFGDGSDEQIKIDSNAAKFPVRLTRAYKSAGNFTIRAEGRKITTHMPCVGKEEARLTVSVRSLPVAPAVPLLPSRRKSAQDL